MQELAMKSVGEIPKYEEKEKKGKNVDVKTFYSRHAEKAGEKIFNEDQFSVSESLISEKGKKDSFELGKQLSESAKHGIKMSWSGNERTLETGRSIIEGHLGETVRKQFNTHIKTELIDRDIPKSFYDIYNHKLGENKVIILAKKGLKPSDLSALAPTEQAEIAEKAEEPVIEEWLNNTDSDLARIYPSEKAASKLAPLVYRDAKIAKKLKSGTDIEQFRMTHKTITEPLLMQIAILENGKKPEKLKDIGGSLGLNEGWEIESTTDEDGKLSIKLFIYRVDRSGEVPVYIKKEYGIDLAALERLRSGSQEIYNDIIEDYK